ncbi:MAG: MFS transporter [Planctomycetota bacterium]|nr:MFS transporter [Planctomycetota bacterium]MDA1250616.1 MFS transporter [Planctomycetota bacterium]
MALSESRWQRVFVLCALYVAQGVPWGFMLITLPNYLVDKFGLSDDDTGELIAIILVPWSFKLLWAPLMESYTIRSMGRRRPWIIGAELMMALTLLGFLGIGDPSQSLNYLIGMYFLHNCFASLQDVCTDALALDVLPPEEQGQTNGLMWGSKLVGKGVGAWGLAYVLRWGGIEACVFVQIGILLLIMLVPLWILERPGEKRLPWSSGIANEFAGSNIRPVSEVMKDVLRAFSLTTLLCYFAFTLLSLVGIGINEVITKTLYSQQLNPKWDNVELSTATGLYAVFPIIAGSVLGGYLGDRYGRRIILFTGFGGYALAAMTFAACPHLWDDRWFSMTYLLSYETLYAIGSVGFLSMAMRISWTTAAATVFTVYMTLSNVSHVVGNWVAGPIRTALTFENAYGDAATLKSYELTFWLIGVLSALPLLILYFVRTDEVDKARGAEPATASADDATKSEAKQEETTAT